MALLRTVCNFCHVRCPAMVEVENEKILKIAPDIEHPFGGLLCVKGKAAGELVEHPDRLLYPLKRVNPKTAAPEWQRVSWNEALDDIAGRLLEIRDRYGAETIVFSKGTKSGTGLADAERWLKRLSNALGTPNTVSTTHPRDGGAARPQPTGRPLLLERHHPAHQWHPEWPRYLHPLRAPGGLRRARRQRPHPTTEDAGRGAE